MPLEIKLQAKKVKEIGTTPINSASTPGGKLNKEMIGPVVFAKETGKSTVKPMETDAHKKRA